MAALSAVPVGAAGPTLEVRERDGPRAAPAAGAAPAPAPVTPIRVHLVAPDRVSGEALAHYFRRRTLHTVVAVTHTVVSAPEATVISKAQAVVLYAPGDVEEAATALSRLRATSPEVPATVVVNGLDDRVAAALIAAGARGLLTLQDTPQRLVATVDVTARGGLAIDHSSISSLLEGLLRPASAAPPLRRPGDLLTERELHVLQLLVDACSTSEIAAQLGITVNTARSHVQRILTKLGVHSRIAATAIAFRDCLVDV